MDLTREEAVRLFREHWKYLAETGSNDKKVWIEENGFYNVAYNCFLCEYKGHGGTCDEHCPISWKYHPDDSLGVGANCMRSYYGLWYLEKTIEERKRLAKIISELPEKEG